MVQAERENVRLIDVVSRPIDPRKLGTDGPAMMGRHLVRAAIVEICKEAGTVGDITIDGVFGELWAVIHSNIDDALIKHPDGWVDWQFDKLSRDQMRAFSSVQIEHFPDGRRKVQAKLWDKLKATDQWLRVRGYLSDDSPLRRLDARTAAQPVNLPGSVRATEAADRYASMLAEMAG